MRHLWKLWLGLTLCSGCGGESDDGGSGSGGGGSGGAAGASGGSGGAASGGSGGLGWGASGGSNSGGSGGAAPSCSCPEGAVCTVWCQGDGKIFKQECVPTPGADAGCSELCGNEYPWSCGFAFCKGAPTGAKICMGA